jgi:hypothetical protein
MPLVNLLNVPKTDQDWAVWGFSHKDSHAKIRQAIQKQKALNLTEYVLDPINPQDVQIFLDNNAQTHKDMNAALGTQGSDLQDADLSTEEGLESWIEIHYQEHYDAETALEI